MGTKSPRKDYSPPPKTTKVVSEVKKNDRKGQSVPQREASKEVSFPKVPVRPELLRRLIKAKANLAELRNRALPYWGRMRPRFLKPFYRMLPKTILVRTKKPIGTRVHEDYCIIYTASLPRGLGWVRELLFSQSSLPQSCLRYLITLVISNCSRRRSNHEP